MAIKVLKSILFIVICIFSVILVIYFSIIKGREENDNVIYDPNLPYYPTVFISELIMESDYIVKGTIMDINEVQVSNTSTDNITSLPSTNVTISVDERYKGFPNDISSFICKGHYLQATEKINNSWIQNEVSIRWEKGQSVILFLSGTSNRSIYKLSFGLQSKFDYYTVYNSYINTNNVLLTPINTKSYIDNLITQIKDFYIYGRQNYI